MEMCTLILKSLSLGGIALCVDDVGPASSPPTVRDNCLVLTCSSVTI